jgi:hypothetical protein
MGRANPVGDSNCAIEENSSSWKWLFFLVPVFLLLYLVVEQV